MFDLYSENGLQNISDAHSEKIRKKICEKFKENGLNRRV